MMSTTFKISKIYQGKAQIASKSHPWRIAQLLALAAVLLLPWTPLRADDDKLAAVDINVETLQDEAVTIDVLTPNAKDGVDGGVDNNKGKGKGNDKDDGLALDSFTQAGNGTVTDNGDGTLTYTPDAGFNGENSFTYTIREGKKEKKGKGKKGKDDESDEKHYATGTITVTVTSGDVPNRAPVITSATTAAATEDEPFSYTATATDADGDQVSFSFTGLPAWVSASGATVSGTPGEGDGDFSFSITASDGNGGTAEATVNVTVTAVNDAPVITSATTATATEDEPFSYTATATDADGDEVILSITGQLPIWASASGATISGTPGEGDGDFTFGIHADDGHGGTDDATVSVTVRATNDAPVADGQSVSTAEDQAVAITLTGSDEDGDALTFTAASPANGSLSGSGANLTYTPDANYNGSDSFTFTVNDGIVNSAAATVSITITAVNDVPVANNDTYTVAEDSDPVVLDVLANDFDADGDALTIQPVKQASGIVHILDNGTLTYEPTPNFSGLDEFIYAITDGFSDPVEATVTVNVTGSNDAPIAEGADFSVDEDASLSGQLSGSDADGDPFTFLLEDGPANGSASVKANGSFTYEPNADFNGSDSFTFTVSDGSLSSAAATVTITVNAVNDAPVANSQSVETDEDTAVLVTLSGFDADGDVVTYSVGQPAGGSLSGSAPNLTYTPDKNFNGSDSFTFTVSDGSLSSAAATVTITVNAVNDAPVANSQSVETDEDTAVLVTLSGFDADGDVLTYSIGQPAGGSLSGSAPNLTYTPDENFNGSDSFTFTVSDGSATSSAATVTITVNAVNDAPVITSATTATATEDEPFSYTATADDAEEDAVSFSFTGLPVWASASGATVSGTPGEGDGDFSFGIHADDGNEGTADATVNVTVTAVNDAPVITSATTAAATEDEPFSYTATATDADGDQVSFSFTGLPAWVSASGATVSGTPGEGDGDFSFSITASDGNGGTDVATVNVTVTAVNDAPVITSATTATATEDEPFSYTATADDAEGDEVTLSITGQLPDWASASGATVSGTPGEGDGDFSFGIHADDGNEGTADATVNVTVNAVNDAPVADAQTVTTGQDETVDISLTASDVDGDDLTFTVSAGPNYGSLSGNAPNLTYTPASGFSGSDVFTFTASDGNGGEDSAQVTIYVNVDEVAVSEEVDENGGTVSWDSDGTGEAVASISIPGGALDGSVNIEISLYSSPPEGAELAGPLFFFGPSGLQFDEPVTITVPYDPDQVPDGVSETDLVVLRYDEGEGSWTALIPSVVDTGNHTVSAQTDHFSGFGAGIPEGTNHAPVIIGTLPSVSIDEDESFAVIITNLTDFFSDADELDDLTIVVLTLDDGLDTVFISDDNLIVIPSENFFGIVHIRITVSDGTASISADITLTINAVNDAPEIVTIADLTLIEDMEVWIPLRATDIEGDAISFSAQSDTSAVVQQVFGDTTLLLVPWPNWSGTAGITVTATDAIGASETSRFNVTFAAANDRPSDFDLLLPVDAHEIQYSSELAGQKLAFSWEVSTDADGENVSYIFILEDEQSTYLLRDTVGTGIEVPYTDLIAIMDDLGVNNLSLWWSIWALSGADSVEALNGPFEIIIYKTLAVESDNHLPQMFALHQNYPNPFNPVTTLRYEMPARTKVNITIYDIRGRKIVELVNGYMHAGYNKVIWNSSDSMGHPVSTGIYFARMVTPEYTNTIKMSLIK